MTNPFEGKSSAEIEALLLEGQQTLAIVRNEEERGDAPSKFPFEAEFYLHSDKDSNRSQGKKLGLSDDQISNFAYAGYEVNLTIEIHEDGSAYAVTFNNVRLPEKVKI